MSTALAKLILPGVFWVENTPPKSTATVASNIVGTAFVIDATNGWLVSAKHVFDGLTPATCRCRSVYSRGSNPLFALGTHLTVSRIERHPQHDIALVQMAPQATAGRALPLATAPLDISEPVLLTGYAGGTDWIYMDGLLGAGSHKSPTPMVVAGTVAALIPHDGRPIAMYVSDVTTHGGNSGGPVASSIQNGVAAVHVAGGGGYGYSLPISLALDYLASLAV